MRLSVVVTIVDAHDALLRCLDALATQDDPPEMEVLVPWDDSVPGMSSMAARFPGFRFLQMGNIATARPTATLAGQHELFDRRRAAGVAAASGDVIAILEDRGVPRPDWARKVVQLHTELPHSVIGGAVENAVDSPLQWSVYFCDFGRYQRPFAAGPRAYVTDVNVSYKRAALQRTSTLWRERYHETTVHWALQRAGETLYLTPELVVEQHRDTLRLGALIAERFSWGRLFAYTRARETNVAKRLALAVFAPVLPVILLARLARSQRSKRVTFRKFLSVSPLVLMLLVAWSLGELVGYVTSRP